MDSISLFLRHRSRLLPWMLQGSKIMLVTSRCALLLFCVTVFWACGRGLQKQMLLQERKEPAGSVGGLCLLGVCHVSTATKHRVVGFIREIQINSELGKLHYCERKREHTVLKMKLCWPRQCTDSI